VRSGPALRNRAGPGMRTERVPTAVDRLSTAVGSRRSGAAANPRTARRVGVACALHRGPAVPTIQAETEPCERLSDDELTAVAAGADPGYNPAEDALGRAGPGQRWSWLGNYYTPEALAHDRAVRGSIATGSSKVMAHVKAFPLLPAAVGSYFRARFHPGPDDMHMP